MLEVFLITLAFVALAILALSIKTYIVKEGKFPETRISKNKALREKGIYCPKTMHKIEQKGCSSCGSYFEEL